MILQNRQSAIGRSRSDCKTEFAIGSAFYALRDRGARDALEIAAQRRPASSSGARVEQLLDLDVLAEAELEDQIAARAQAAGGLRRPAARRGRGRRRRRTARPPARDRALPAAAPAARDRRRTAGWRRSRRTGRRGRRADRRARSVMRSATPCRAALRRATSSAGSRDVGGDDRARAGRSCASATATQPLPVQTSAIASGARPIGKQLQHRLDDQLGLRARNQDVRRHFERQPPELARADDVGERLAA